MKAVLICPAERPAMKLLSQGAPLSNVPLLGQGLLEYWLSHLACAGARQVFVLAQDRVEQVRALAGDGVRWGLEVEVRNESRELTPDQALLKYAPELDRPPEQSPVAVLDHFPGHPERPLFGDYAGFFAGLLDWMSHAITPDRVGMREVRPGVWVGRQARIAPSAQLYTPCWIGHHAYVGARAILGPRTIVEDGAFLEEGVEIADSCVGPHTFVGRFAQLKNSIAWGSALLNWQSGSVIQVADAFLLCALRSHPKRQVRGGLTRLAELFPRNKEEAALLWKQLLLNKEG